MPDNKHIAGNQKYFWKRRRGKKEFYDILHTKCQSSYFTKSKSAIKLKHNIPAHRWK
jgi:hypothetical protein